MISYAADLAKTEMRYCQTEKEALAWVWAVERFWLSNWYSFRAGNGRPHTLKTIFEPNSRPCT